MMSDNSNIVGINARVTRSILDVLHYSRAEHILMASLMTATTSIVLLGNIHWRSVVIVFLGTYFVYSVDNLIDWSGERHLLPVIRKIWSHYVVQCFFFLPLSLLTIVFLVWHHKQTLFALALLGTFSLLQVFITKQTVQRYKSQFSLWLERLTDAIVWSLVTVFVPVTYNGSGIYPQVIMVIAFNLFITFTIVMVWDFTRAATNGNHHDTPVLADVLGTYKIISLLKVLCISGLMLASVDILLGYFPIYNLIVLLVPSIYLWLLYLYNGFSESPLIYSSLFSLASIVSCLFIISVYALAV